MIKEAYQAGFDAGFEKVSVDLPTFRKATSRILKDHGIRRTASTTESGALSFAKNQADKIGPAVIPDPHPELKLPIFWPSGNPSSLLKERGTDLGKLDPLSHEVLNRSAAIHEQSERYYMKKPRTMFDFLGSHADPGVLLRDNNVAATLPPQMAKQKELLVNFRDSSDPSKALLEAGVPGFRYGNQRYSRHAIKHMSSIFKKNRQYAELVALRGLTPESARARVELSKQFGKRVAGLSFSSEEMGKLLAEYEREIEKL